MKYHPDPASNLVEKSKVLTEKLNKVHATTTCWDCGRKHSEHAEGDYVS